MKIRAQLVLAFLLLAVVPLTAIVLYSYFTAINAVEDAVEAESNVLTAEMDQRLRGIKTVLRQRLEGLRELPFGSWLGQGEEPEAGRVFVGRLMAEIGEAAPYLEALTFLPETPATPQAPGEAPLPPLPPAPPGADPELAPMVIDLPRLLSLGRQAGEDPEAREELGREVAELALVGVREALRALATPESPEIEGAVAEVERETRRVREEAEKARQERRAIVVMREDERLAVEERHREAERLLSTDFGVKVREKGEVVGELQAQVDAKKLLHSVLHSTPRHRGEIPFAFDAEGRLYPADEADRPRLEALGLERDPDSGEVRPRQGTGDWVVVSQRELDSELVFGIARPIGDSLAAIRRTTIHNLGIGLVLIALAFVGVLPLSRRISRGLDLLEIEYERKSRELEEARQFQLSLLPKTLPDHPAYEVAVDMRTATEVGGDYYDFHLAGGVLTVAVGDATGHGARAGTMVTVVKSLFSSAAADASPGEFLIRAAAAIKRMDLGRMAMALTVVRFDDGALTLAAAGMPPALVRRAAGGEVEELELPGMPLGGLDCHYQERRVELAGGDVVLLLSDGLPELPDPRGEPFGYARVRGAFAAAAAEPAAILAELTSAALTWTEGRPAADDMTFVIVKRKAH
jgi:serine phosphatase RsbU (regulator of sigma subunit)